MVIPLIRIISPSYSGRGDGGVKGLGGETGGKETTGET